MQIERVHDAARLNQIVNDPSVYPWVHGNVEGPLDLSGIVADPRHVALVGRHGGVLFVQHGPGIYEAHTQVLPEGRGTWTVEMVRAALQWMFTHTDAVEIGTRVPKGNLAARALAKTIGGRLQFRAERGWQMDGVIVWADIFALSIQDWMRDAPGLADIGEWFHRTLAAEYERLGHAEPIHPDDAAHDRYVGAAVAMMRGGQPFKAAIFYNRFAIMAGVLPITILQTDPIMVGIREGVVLELHGQNFFVASVATSAKH